METHQKNQIIREQRWRTIALREGLDPEIVPEFADIFVQPSPKYSIEVEKKIKDPLPFEDEKTVSFWVTGKKHPLGYSHVSAHLTCIRSIGSISKWYPTYGLIDIDSRGLDEARDIRSAMGMDFRNSILAKTRSPDSYHILYKPIYAGKPMTANLYQAIGAQIAELYRVEVYPQKEHCVRLPFGKFFSPIGEGREDLDVTGLMNEFEALDEYETKEKWGIEQINTQSLFNRISDYGMDGTWYEKGKIWYVNGLSEKGTRYEAQAHVIYYLYRRNTPPEANIEITYKWLKNKHHGFSDAINAGRYQRVKNEIRRQVKWFYETFGYLEYLPDTIHNGYDGYITKPDLEEIVRVTKGNLPRSRFLSQVIKYANPRQSRPYIRIHTDKFIKWSSMRSYIKFLEDFEKAGIIKRNNAFSPGEYSKAISFESWTFRESRQGIYIDERTPETFDLAVRAIFDPRDYKSLLKAAGANRQNCYDQVNHIFT